MANTVENPLTTGQAAETIAFFLTQPKEEISEAVEAAGWRFFGDALIRDTEDISVTIAPEAAYQADNPDQKEIEGKDLELTVLVRFLGLASGLYLLELTNIDNLSQLGIAGRDEKTLKQGDKVKLLTTELENLALALVNNNQR